MVLAALLLTLAAPVVRAETKPGAIGRPHHHRAPRPAARAAARPASRPVTLSVVGTSDLHGALGPRDGRGGLAVFAGYLENLRAARARDGGAVLLIDSGDMFQGTLESNLTEGAPVIRAYNSLGYDAVAIGNHEFDYGPAGPAMAPENPGDDPFGALRARIAEARFPFLSANLRDRETGRPFADPGVKPSVLLRRGGIKIGVIGVTTAATLRATLAANVRTLALLPLLESIHTQAAALRARGAEVVVVAAHAGGRCSSFTDATDLTSCDAHEEIMEVAQGLAEHEVDAILAGHTHQGMAHVVNGIPIVEAWSSGRAFSRIDLKVDSSRGVVLERVPLPPQEICQRVVPGKAGCAVLARPENTVAATYEGREVRPSATIEALLAPDFARAATAGTRPLGVVAEAPIRRARDQESALGNLVADLMLVARPEAQVALTNGGGLRADLRAGPIDYRALYEVYPFDNRMATARLTGRELGRILARNLSGTEAIWSIAGTRARASCKDGALAVETDFADDQQLLLITSDFFATSGPLAELPPGAVELESGPTVRDELARVLEKRGGRLKPLAFYDPAKPRLIYEGDKPIHCARARTGSRQ